MKCLLYEKIKKILVFWLIKQLGCITVCNKDIWIINIKDKELLFHLKADISIRTNESKMFMKELWVEILRSLNTHIVIFKDSLVKNVDRGKEPKFFQDVMWNLG